MSKNVVLVTGAAGGIGRSICERLVADGYSVAATDINAEGLKDLEASLGGSLKAYPADQTDLAKVEALVAQAEKDLGPIFGLVNVTGWTHATRFETETADYWDKVIAINFTSLLYVTQPILKSMIARKAGRMVFIASDAGKVGTATEAVYAGAKGAVIAFAKSIARENARHSINVNCVSPGPTETPLFAEEMKDNPQIVERMLKAIPFRRAAKPSDQAAVVSFLLSDDASYLTGQALSVSGGLTMI
ncbi:SDR family NAD(P)-dependent oxidoreductase [Mesorhizobium retamae]|uniref:SDR family oxidoreductase n=1 Tax=Mesorhizobium retamae TaxID=2912854 RepID=A0ABS9QF22_9HYPH|nr:SDR family oxidoreductase [Mesorhizobium sp. IRAMC:0171]MCG7505401.1 SDR family oxidoreductase [Mesorhizobium sp. IRAMC:0171]